MSGSVRRYAPRLLPAAALLLAACAYSFSSGLPPHIKTVAVPLFANETSEFGIAEEITDLLVAALVKDGTLRVVADEGDASSVILGTVRTYSEEPYTYNREETVGELIIRISVEVRFQDRVKDEVIWESQRVFGSATYDNLPETEDRERDAGLARAIDQVVEEILNGIVAGW